MRHLMLIGEKRTKSSVGDKLAALKRGSHSKHYYLFVVSLRKWHLRRGLLTSSARGEVNNNNNRERERVRLKTGSLLEVTRCGVRGG